MKHWRLTEGDVVARAKQKVLLASQNKLPWFKTRWNNVNAMLDGGIVAPCCFAIGSMSGGGKSLMAALLREDFSNPLLSPWAEKVVFLHFGLDMAVENEVLRSLQRNNGKTINEMLGIAAPQSELQYMNILRSLDKMKSSPKPIEYVERPPTVDQMKQIVIEFVNDYPGRQHVVIIDHTLLIQTGQYEDENELIGRLSNTALELAKQYNLVFILLSQLNDKIEQDNRILKHELHAPKKTDFFGSKKMFHAMDLVAVIHRPELLHIDEYWIPRIPTANLMVWHQIKNRHYKPGWTKLYADLSNGQFLEWDKRPKANNSVNFLK